MRQFEEDVKERIKYLQELYSSGVCTRIEFFNLVISELTIDNAAIVFSQIPTWLASELDSYYRQVVDLYNEGRIDDLLNPLSEERIHMAIWYQQNMASDNE